MYKAICRIDFINLCVLKLCSGCFSLVGYFLSYIFQDFRQNYNCMLHSIVYLRLLELLFANGVFKVFISIEVLFTLALHPSGQFAH